MEISEIVAQYLAILLSCFQFDVNVFSNIWLYLPLMIPFMFYFVFFMIKWYILTAPLWLPFALVGRVCMVVLKESKTKRVQK